MEHLQKVCCSFYWDKAIKLIASQSSLQAALAIRCKQVTEATIKTVQDKEFTKASVQRIKWMGTGFKITVIKKGIRTGQVSGKEWEERKWVHASKLGTDAISASKAERISTGNKGTRLD